MLIVKLQLDKELTIKNNIKITLVPISNPNVFTNIAGFIVINPLSQTTNNTYQTAKYILDLVTIPIDISKIPPKNKQITITIL